MGWGVRCPILVGREGPVSLIADAIRRLRSGNGAALVVVGEAGVGKTRLAEYLDDAAAAAGLDVVHGRALPEGLGGSLRPVAEMLLELTRDRTVPGDAGLAPYVSVLASLVPHWRDPGWSAPAEPVVVMAEAVLRVLQWATGGAGIVVILEDLHWADDATLAVTRYLADHASEVPVLVFGTIRTGEGRADTRALLEAGGAQICPIGRLTDDEAREMATACAAAGSPAGKPITSVVREAEGLPLLVEDLLATGDLEGIAPRFGDTVRARLARLDARQRTVLGAAAVLGHRFDWRLLDQVAGVQRTDVAEALHRCTALQLVVTDGPGFAFRHALTRDVILAWLGVPERCRLSLAAAVEMLRDARGGRLEQARSEASRAGALGLATGIGANLAALMAMTARFEDAMEVARDVEQTSRRLGLIPLQAAALLMQGFALAHQGRAREMEHYLTAAEAAAPDDPDLRAGAWAIGRGIGALLAEDRSAARQAFARARAAAPDQHARILNPYEGPELLLRALAGEAGQAEIETASAGMVKGARWPGLWFGAARAVARGADGDAAGAAAALDGALNAGDRYPVFSALTMRLVAEAAIRDSWGDPGTLLRSADAAFVQMGLGRASAACRALLKATGQAAPRRRAADAGLPAPLIAAGVTAREAEVLDLLADRLTNREIADRLFLSPRTVEKHVAALLAKLGSDDRGGLARLARSLH